MPLDRAGPSLSSSTSQSQLCSGRSNAPSQQPGADGVLSRTLLFAQRLPCAFFPLPCAASANEVIVQPEEASARVCAWLQLGTEILLTVPDGEQGKGLQLCPLPGKQPGGSVPSPALSFWGLQGR